MPAVCSANKGSCVRSPGKAADRSRPFPAFRAAGRLMHPCDPGHEVAAEGCVFNRPFRGNACRLRKKAERGNSLPVCAACGPVWSVTEGPESFLTMTKAPSVSDGAFVMSAGCFSIPEMGTPDPQAFSSVPSLFSLPEALSVPERSRAAEMSSSERMCTSS